VDGNFISPGLRRGEIATTVTPLSGVVMVMVLAGSDAGAVIEV
jgi:hypothetical protein